MKIIKINMIFIFSFVIFLTANSCIAEQGKPILYSFDTEKLGSKNMKIVAEETSNNKNISVIRERVYTRGSYAGAAMFSMCSSVIITKNRGYSHFVILDQKSNGNCKECEWSQDTTIGMINDVNPGFVSNMQEVIEETRNDKSKKLEVVKYLSQIFPQYKINEEHAEILAVSDFMVVCGRVQSICSW